MAYLARRHTVATNGELAERSGTCPSFEVNISARAGVNMVCRDCEESMKADETPEPESPAMSNMPVLAAFGTLDTGRSVMLLRLNSVGCLRITLLRLLPSIVR